ncbi:hypothetical protein LX36DRAFT_256323 [Colletotrichum falcatum]|nr:hypothetical protein LX36DRAFT_256323 [Colletotrichum falcatum]
MSIPSNRPRWSTLHLAHRGRIGQPSATHHHVGNAIGSKAVLVSPGPSQLVSSSQAEPRRHRIRRARSRPSTRYRPPGSPIFRCLRVTRGGDEARRYTYINAKAARVRREKGRDTHAASMKEANEIYTAPLFSVSHRATCSTREEEKNSSLELSTICATI